MDAYKSLEHIRHKLEDVTEQKCDLDSEAKSLKSKVKQLEDKLQVLEGINIEKKELEDQARELSVKLGDHERLQIEHTTLQENLKITTNLLDERVFYFCYNSARCTLLHYELVTVFNFMELVSCQRRYGSFQSENIWTEQAQNVSATSIWLSSSL